MPGEREFRIHARRMDEGIPLPREVARKLRKEAEDAGIVAPF